MMSITRIHKTLCLLLCTSLMVACTSTATKPSNSDAANLYPDWESLAYSYPEPLPFPILGKLRSKAQVAYHEQDYASAQLLLDQMFRVDPKRPDVMALKAWVFCKQAQYDEAKLWLKRARGYLQVNEQYDVLLAEAERDCR